MVFSHAIKTLNDNEKDTNIEILSGKIISLFVKLNKLLFEEGFEPFRVDVVKSFESRVDVF